MKFTKYTALAAVLAFSAAASFAQDFDDFGDFGDTSTSSAGGASSSVKISGEVKMDSRAYFDTKADKKGINCDKAEDMELAAFPAAKLNFAYSGATVDAEVKLKFDKKTVTEYKWDMVDEAVIRGFFMDNALTVEGGKMRALWGKGDRLHVIDNFNADDYTDFIVPLYSDRRIAVPMLKATYAFPVNNLALEAVFTPTMEADRFGSGRWTPGKMASLQSVIKDAVGSNLGIYLSKKDATAVAYLADTSDILKKSAYQNATADYLNYLTYANSLLADPSSIYPDTNSLKYSQAGLRLTGTFGSVDFGASYYYGHYKQPSVNLEKYITSAYINASNPSSTFVLPELAYDQKQTFGLEAATIFWKLNLRGEVCYNLTEDTKGDNPWVKNNSVQWLAGFDIDLPVNNINVNIQETGTYILNNDKIAGIYKAYDVDYDSNDCYTNNRLVVNITDSWQNGKIEPEVTFLWGIERGDFIVMPKLNFKPNQDITFTLSGLFMFAKDSDSEFADWSGEEDGFLNNSFVNVGISCKF